MNSKVTGEPSSEGRSLWKKTQLTERSLRYAAGGSRKLTLGLRRYFQVLKSETKGSGSPVVFCRCSQGFLAFMLLFSIHVRTSNIQQAPERTQPLLKISYSKGKKNYQRLHTAYDKPNSWGISCGFGAFPALEGSSFIATDPTMHAEVCGQWPSFVFSENS